MFGCVAEDRMFECMAEDRMFACMAVERKFEEFKCAVSGRTEAEWIVGMNVKHMFPECMRIDVD